MVERRRDDDFYGILTDALNDLIEHGFDSIERLQFWERKLRRAAELAATQTDDMERMLRDGLTAVYRRLVERGELMKHHPGIGKFTVAQFTPQMRAELDRRIMASAQLIKLNRDEVIEKTIRRFSGWATSIPKGGTESADKRKTKDEIRKPLASLPFVERRVLIDQSHKLRASISNVLATENGAIAAVWHSHWRELNYDYRVKHAERDEKIYLVRDSWARAKGFVKPRSVGFLDEITQPAEEPFCRCFVTWIYSLQKLPDDMLTRKGKDEIERVEKLKQGIVA